MASPGTRSTKCYVGTISLGYDDANAFGGLSGARPRQVKDKLEKLREEINAGVRTPANYTVELCVKDWLDSIERDPHTMETLTGQAENWIYPRIGATKLRDFTATDADKFFKELGQVLSKRTLVMIKSTLRRSIRRAQVHDLIARNVVELIDLPGGQPGRPSRAMTLAQASKVLKAASGQRAGFVKVVRRPRAGTARPTRRRRPASWRAETSRTRTRPSPTCPPNSKTRRAARAARNSA